MIDRRDVYHKDLLKALFREEYPNTEWPPEVAAETPLAFFNDFVNYNFSLIAEEFGCEVILHERRVEEAFDAWHADLKHKPNRVHESDDLDRFKRAGFLCYWLRRRYVVDEIRPIMQTPLTKRYSDDLVNLFVAYGNELSSFYLGYKFCIRFQFTALGAGNAMDHANALSREILYKMKLDSKFREEIAVCLKFKNVSPHSIYLIYKGLLA